jgi:transposase-like protein
MAILADASTDSLQAFLTDHVQEGSTVITDGWQPYRKATGDRYTHQRHVVPGPQAAKLLPGVHRVASLAKRWLLGTHQARVAAANLQAYLDEFTFRFNRRHSRARDMLFYRLLEQVVQATPRTYRSLVADPGSRGQTLPVPPLNKRVHCDSLASEALDRPLAP